MLLFLNNSNFLKVHRSFLINKQYLESIGYEEIVVGGKEIPVPRKLWKMVLTELKS